MARPLDNAIYNEAMDMWMLQQNDPYTLANFQKAYDNLASGNSVQTLTRSQAEEFSIGEPLRATHYALKIYPRTIHELWDVELMEDVQVAYTPFDYVPLTEEETEIVLQSQTRSISNTFAEGSPYEVSYEGHETSDGGPVASPTLRLPILYTVWPVDKPLPEALEYVMDYEIFLPRAVVETRAEATNHGAEALSILENEAVALALGLNDISTPSTTRATAMRDFSSTLMTYDDVVNQNVPLANIQVISQLGSSMETRSHTDDTGYFTVQIPVNTTSASVQYTIYFAFLDWNGRWRLTTNNNLTPTYFGTLTIRNNSTDPIFRDKIIVPPSSNQASQIHRAANFYWNDQSHIPRFPYSSGQQHMTIVASTGSHSEKNGLFAWDDTHSVEPIITIFNNSLPQSMVIGTTLHEIGHYAHYQDHVYRPKNYEKTPDILRESFASFCGWYMGEMYYRSLGWIKPSADSDITGNGRQYWYKDFAGNLAWYTPLFIDLVDDYNQRTPDYPHLLDDTISGTGVGAIWQAISKGVTWTACKAVLQNYVGFYYTQDQLDAYTFDYAYWFAVNQPDKY